MEIVIKGEKLILCTERALFWPQKKTLILADMHLGKPAYFRSKGIQIPSTVMLKDLERLRLLIEKYQAEKVIVAGDMFHHKQNADVQLFAEWRQKYSGVQFFLVPGNHDKLLAIDYTQLDIQVLPNQFTMGPFCITHKREDVEVGDFALSGHIHPGYLMEGRARQIIRMPCYIVADNYIVLPAFSQFTGLYAAYEKKQDHVYYLVSDNDIFKV